MSTAFKEAFAEDNNQEEEFKPLEPGTYVCSLLEVETESNPFDQEQQTCLTYEIKEGNSAKRRIWDTIKHTDNLAWKAARIYRDMKLEGDPDTWDEWASAIRGCKGRVYEVSVTQREYNGKTYINVNKVNPCTDNAPF